MGIGVLDDIGKGLSVIEGRVGDRDATCNGRSDGGGKAASNAIVDAIGDGSSGCDFLRRMVTDIKADIQSIQSLLSSTTTTNYHFYHHKCF